MLGPDGRISQAGIALPEGIPLHLLHGDRSSMDNFFGYGTSVYNVSAVSGVLATRRDTYQQLGGLNPQFRDLALIDYCLRATDTGQRVVIVPDARLRATGPDTTINDLPDDLATAPELGADPHPRSLLQPQLPHRPRRLRADPGLSGMPRSALRVLPPVFRGRRSAGPATGSRLPLSALRGRLDEESAASSWLLHPDGVLGRALLMPAGATFTVPLRLSGEASFSGRAMLLPHDWRDGRGAVRASVAITGRGRPRARALVGHAPGVGPGQAPRPARRLPAPGP